MINIPPPLPPPIPEYSKGINIEEIIVGPTRLEQRDRSSFQLLSELTTQANPKHSRERVGLEFARDNTHNVNHVSGSQTIHWPTIACTQCPSSAGSFKTKRYNSPIYQHTYKLSRAKLANKNSDLQWTIVPTKHDDSDRLNQEAAWQDPFNRTNIFAKLPRYPKWAVLGHTLSTKSLIIIFSEVTNNFSTWSLETCSPSSRGSNILFISVIDSK